MNPKPIGQCRKQHCLPYLQRRTNEIYIDLTRNRHLFPDDGFFINKLLIKRCNMFELPEKFTNFKQDFPEIFEAYEKLGEIIHYSAKLDDKSRHLVKLALAIGAGLEGAVHSHTRKAIEIGCSKEEIHSVVLLSLTTLGFPSMMKSMTWVDDILNSLK